MVYWSTLMISVTKFENEDNKKALKYYDSVSIGEAANLFLSPLKPKPKRK